MRFLRSAAPSIRARLTLWYALALTATMIVYATVTYVAVRHEFLEQLDDQLYDDVEVAKQRLTRTADGRVAWSGDHPGRDTEQVYEAWSSTGERIYRSGASATLAPAAVANVGSTYRHETISADDEKWRALTAWVTIGGHAVVLRAARSEERLSGQLWEIFLVLVLGLPLVVVLAGVGGYVLARRALAPIDHLATEARRITADRLHERLTTANPHDEIGRLTAVINDAVARLESSFDQLRRFTSDASHELRTPLAVVRGIGEATVATRRSPAEYEEAIGSILEEVDRMTSLTDTLLRLSRADAGTIRLSRERVDLGDLTREVASSLSILADERHLELRLDVGHGATVSVDRLVLREAITNILDNAIKFSPPGTTVSIRVERSDHHALLAIADKGPGIPAEERERIFDRFFRLDEARSRERGGAGLGLAIAKWAVEMHNGQITVEARAGGGSEFRIVLPLAAADALKVDDTKAHARAGGSR